MSSKTSFTGRVRPGRGLGAIRMADDAVLRPMEEMAGMSLVPGTLNVVLDEPFVRPKGTLRVSAAEIAGDWAERTGQSGYYFTPVLIAGRFHGIAMQAEEEGYPPEQVELLSDVVLRDALGLEDDGEVRFSAAEF